MKKNKTKSFELIMKNRVIKGYKGVCPARLVIPEGTGEIGNDAFNCCLTIEELIVPERGDRAFLGCSGLKKAVYPAKAALGVHAFKDIPAVPFALQIENGAVTGYNGVCPERPAIPGEVRSIGEFAFFCCKTLKEITLPEGLREIGDWAFAAGGPEKAGLPEGLGRIGESAFAGCRLKEINIPESVREIGEKAFCCCKSLKKVTRPGGAATGSEAFREVPAVPFELQIENGAVTGYNGVCPERLAIPGGVTEISYDAFCCCMSLKEIVLPESVKRLKAFSFNSCERLEKAVLPEGLRRIGDYAFAGCGALKTVCIPGSVREVGEGAFAGCKNPPRIPRSGKRRKGSGGKR